MSELFAPDVKKLNTKLTPSNWYFNFCHRLHPNNHKLFYYVINFEGVTYKSEVGNTNLEQVNLACARHLYKLYNMEEEPIVATKRDLEKGLNVTTNVGEDTINDELQEESQ
jgi:hypothetical protein